MDSIKSLNIWLRLPDLPLEVRGKEIIMKIVAGAGKLRFLDDEVC